MPDWEKEKVHRKIGDMVLDLMANAKKMPQSDDYDIEKYADTYFNGKAMYRKEGENANDGQIHYPDTFKYPNHQAFSDESMYRIGQSDVPHWYGGKLPAGLGESWATYRPNGELVFSEAPWNEAGMRASAPYR